MLRSVRLHGAIAALALLVTTGTPGHAQTTWGVSVNIGNAPPPPVVVVKSEPRMVVVPGSTVYVVNDDRYDYDCFRSGAYWYAWNGGYWYRARAWRGPFVVVETRTVPRAVLQVPMRHWKHHPHGGPPGLAKKQNERAEIRTVSQPGPEVVVVKSKKREKRENPRKDR